MQRKYVLCGKDSCCPAVEVSETEVRIGEDDNTCVLKPDEWQILRQLVLDGRL